MPAAWNNTQSIPIEQEVQPLWAVQRPLGQGSRRRRQPAERPDPTVGVRGALPSAQALHMDRAGCWRSGDENRVVTVEFHTVSAPRAPRLHGSEPVSLSAGQDIGPAVGTVSPIGGDYRGGELRPRFDRSPVKARSERQSKKNRCSVAVASFFVMAVWFFSTTTPAWSRPPVPAPVFKAVRAFWKTKAERVEAFNIVACETGNRYNTTAQNGQYLGLFQMGSFARARYGHSWTAWGQARAAHRYYLEAGWSPWSCA